MRRVYENDRIRIIWEPDKCIHVAYCIRELPQVFDVRRRPWVNIDGASVEEIKRVIDTCPSGALTYELPGSATGEPVTITVCRDGPYRVCGQCRVLTPDGSEIATKGTFALCRCGHSRRMPICDGTHFRVGFKDAQG